MWYYYYMCAAEHVGIYVHIVLRRGCVYSCSVLAMSNGEERTVGLTVEALLTRVRDTQHTIMELLKKLDLQDRLEWPSLLESFAVVSSQISSIHTLLRNDKTPALRGWSVLPIRLALEFDPELQKQTDGRISAFTHQVAPDYLRTKPEPDVEAQEKQLLASMSRLNPENVQKQINAMNKCVSTVLDLISNAANKDDWDPEASNLPTTSSTNDTQTLIGAVTVGKGLKLSPNQKIAAAIPPGMQPQQQINAGGKYPSAMKAATKPGSGPYQR